jgi:hypothetical protein
VTLDPFFLLGAINPTSSTEGALAGFCEARGCSEGCRLDSRAGYTVHLSSSDLISRGKAEQTHRATRRRGGAAYQVIVSFNRAQ